MPDEGAPARIGRYRLVEEVGHGGMSTVYRGHDEALDRDVAVKVLHSHLARDPAARERFAREARAVAQLEHRNIPEIYDFASGEEGPNHLVTEFVDGPSLSSLLQADPPLLPELGAMIVVGLAEALAHAHGHGIIHRDVKPENVLLGRDGIVKLTDFGIVQVVGLESMTTTGTLVGSPAHMAPEQIEHDRELDYRADIWGLGTVLYAAATGGILPFEAPTTHGVLKAIVEGRYADPRRVCAHVDGSLAEIIRRCLRTDPRERYADARDLAEDLRRWLAQRELDEPEAELRTWLASPEAYRDELEERLVRALMSCGVRDHSQGQPHRALEHYGRVLTLRPDHPEAVECIRDLHAGRRRRFVVRGAVGLACLAALAGGWWWSLPAEEGASDAAPVRGRVLRPLSAPAPPPGSDRGHRAIDPGEHAGRRLARHAPSPEVVRRARAGDEAPGSQEAATDTPTATATPGTGSPNPPDGPDDAKGRPSNDAPEGAPDDAPEPTARRPGAGAARDGAGAGERDVVDVRLTAEPPAVRIHLDDERIRPGSVVQLAPGEHELVLEHPGCDRCEPTRRTVRVPENPGEQPVQRHVRFAYQPAEIRVECEDGKVLIDGETYGPCGRSYRVPVLSHTPEVGEITVELSDGDVRRRNFTLRPSAQVRWELDR